MVSREGPVRVSDDERRGYDDFFRAEQPKAGAPRPFKLPAVIRLLRYVKIKRRFDYVPFSRANIYARDHHSCQYCNKAVPTPELTFDHVRFSYGDGTERR